MTTTPDEFLQFAKEMGLDRIKSTSLTPLSNNNNNNGYSLTGLSVLNNLCHLIEHIHVLKAENDRLRAHLELVNHMEKFLLKTEENHKEKKRIQSDESRYNERKSVTLLPSNSLKIKPYGSPSLLISSRERQGTDFFTSHEDSSSILHTDHDQSEMMDSTLGFSALPNWSKVRDVLRFSLRRKPDSSTSPVLTHTERTIPSISISFESDDDHVQDNKRQRKKKKTSTTNDIRRGPIGEDTDQEDESVKFNRAYYKRKLYRNGAANSSSNERPEISTSTSPITSTTIDDDSLLMRKQSKIAHYRRKLRSKLDTVKKQFTDQNSTSSIRLPASTHGSTFDDIGSGLNHALLTAKLAPAMTKAYQQKMHEWQSMQKSNFLVNYRRQSIINKIDLNHDSRKTSITSTINEASIESTDNSNLETENKLLTFSPILSPNQRSLIVHQWRQIMSEEIFLRHYNEYLQRKMQELKQLETDLKSSKTRIFCTNNREYFLKHRSMTCIEQLDQDLLDEHRQIYLPQRSRSYQSLISMPASWILAVQSAAYSDILDGTSKKTTERAIISNKNFFNQLKHFKNARQHFEQEIITDLQTLRNSKTNRSYEKNVTIQPRKRIILTRGCLRRLSLITPNEIPQMIPSNLVIQYPATISKLETSSHINLLSPATTNELETSLPSSSITLNKRTKRSRFDFKKTLQRSKSMCMTQFHSWLQRRRQNQHQSLPRRKSAMDSKTMSSLCSTPTLLGSPRLARLHQKIFKQHPSSPSLLPQSSPVIPLAKFPSSSSPFLDDSDRQFQKQESPVRIYLPARTPPTIHHTRVIDNNGMINDNIQTPPMTKITSPIINRRNVSSPSMKIITARERRESYATLSHILNNK